MTGHRAVRFRDEFEMRCDDCNDWWPMTTQFWYPRRGLARCLACDRDRGAAVWRRLRSDALLRERQRRSCAEYKRLHRDELNAKQRARYWARKVAA